MHLKHFFPALILSTQVIAMVGPLRCETSGDSLDAKKAIGRRAWAHKCFPLERGLIKLHAKMIDKKTNEIIEGYPTFAVINNDGEVSNPKKWFAPTDEKASCDTPLGYRLISYCGAGCYTPEQKIRFKNRDEAIGDAYEQELSEIITLDGASDLKNLKLGFGFVDYYVTDLVPGTHDVLVFHMLSGGSLRVTHEHPLVDSKGRMRSAISLEVDEALVMANGDFDRIISIESEQYFGKVYNLEVSSSHRAEKIIIAQGYLSGTVYYQNEGLRELNRVILRTNLIPDFLVN